MHSTEFWMILNVKEFTFIINYCVCVCVCVCVSECVCVCVCVRVCV